MTILVPLMLFGWIPVTVLLFAILKPHQAVLFSVIGGWLFLPIAGYDPQGFPEYTKVSAISIGLVLGGRISGKRQAVSFKWKLYDLPVIIFCISSIATSVLNQLGFYDGVANCFAKALWLGVPYTAGRVYFNSTDSLRSLCKGIIVGGLLYVPLCLYEIRMSPQLHTMLYGFFQHSFAQHVRYGGWRPAVFMQHGLMVSFWMAIASVVAFWAWRTGGIKDLKGLPMSFCVVVLSITAILCKSVNGWFALVVGCACYMFSRIFNIQRIFFVFFLIVPFYIGLRSVNIISGEELTTLASLFLDSERVGSFSARLIQEDLFCLKAWERPLFGWGGYNRASPVDPASGQIIEHVIDSLWLATYSSSGFVGLFSVYFSIMIGPFLLFKNGMLAKYKDSVSILNPVVILSLVLMLFAVDSLLNAMVNPLFFTISGAIISYYEQRKEKYSAIAKGKIITASAPV